MTLRVTDVFAFVLLLLGPLAARAVADEEDTKAADAELRRQVNIAIDKGAKHLASKQAADGSFPAGYNRTYPMGPTALATLALLHSGVPRSDPQIQKAFAHLRKIYEGIIAESRKGGGRNPYAAAKGLKVYSVSILIMALAEYGRVRSSHDEDSGYAKGSLDSFRLNKPDLTWMKELTNWLVSVQLGTGAWRYPEGGVDNSNSQYACLALNEAREVGIKVPQKTFEKALNYWLDAQENKGPRVPRYNEEGGDGVYGATRYRTGGSDQVRGWGYFKGNPATGSMTTAGVAGTAICLHALRGSRLTGRAKQSIRDGLAWLGHHFSVTSNPKMGAGWHYYYLYGLERAGVLGDVVYMGKHRWYAEGARFLVDAQSDGGGFRGRAAERAQPRKGGRVVLAGNVGLVDQCFALLFLTRATARVVRGTPTESPSLDLSKAGGLDASGASDLFWAAFEQAIKYTDERFARRAPQFAVLGPRAIPHLLRLLDDSDEKRRALAAAILRAITAKSFGFDARMPEERRSKAVDGWTGWYLTNRTRLRYDPETRRIR